MSREVTAVNAENKTSFKNFLKYNNDSVKLFIILIVVFAVMSVVTGGSFFNERKLINIAYLFPEFGVLSLGMMLAMVTGGIDLSVVAAADLSGILSCMVLIRIMPENASLPVQILILLITLLLSLLIGAVCGLFTGTLIAKVGIPPMLATLGSSDVILGVAVAITQGSSVKNLPMILSDVINTNVFSVIPATTLIFAICVIIIAFILKKTPFGLKVYMLGANPKASKYSGIDNKKILTLIYMMSGMLSAVAGLLMCGHFNSARSDFGKSYTLQAILVCVLAGVNPKGGHGKFINIVLAVLILQTLSSGFSMFSNISDFYRNLIWGLVLLFVITFNVVSNRIAMKKKLHT